MARDPIGRLRQRITVIEPEEEEDGAGGVRRTYRDAQTVWACVEPMQGVFRLTGDYAGQTITHRVIVREGVRLTSQTRLRHGTALHHIRSVHTADRGEGFLVVLTEEISA